MFSSLRSRLWLSYALLITAALFIVTVFFIYYLVVNPPESRRLNAQMNLALSALTSQTKEWSGLPAPRLRAFLREQDQFFNLRWLLIHPESGLLFDSRAAGAPPLNLARLNWPSRWTRLVSDAEGAGWLAVVRRLPNGNLLVAATPRPRISVLSVLADEFLPPIILGGLMALVLALILAYWMARWVAAPLQNLLDAAARLPEHGPQPLQLRGPREVQELLKAFNQMAQRMQASQKSQKSFVANVSHELKTPLTSIQGFAQALLDGAADTPEAQRTAAQVIYDESARMHRMVLDLLDLARLDAGMLEIQRHEVELAALLRAVVARFAPQAEQAQIQLRLAAPDLPAIPGDGDRLAQVFTNLVENAIKFTPPGGEIRLQARPTGEWVEVLVQDNGSGIAPERLPHIFERFYQADPARPGGARHGSGLGLAIADEIVRAHGGKIRAQSALGRGSLFIVSLPRARDRSKINI